MAYWSCPYGDYEIEGDEVDVEEKRREHLEETADDSHHKSASQGKENTGLEDKLKNLLDDLT